MLYVFVPIVMNPALRVVDQSASPFLETFHISFVPISSLLLDAQVFYCRSKETHLLHSKEVAIQEDVGYCSTPRVPPARCAEINYRPAAHRSVDLSDYHMVALSHLINLTFSLG